MAVQKFYVLDLGHDDERIVEEALESIDGVLYAAANHRDRCAEVEFEDDTATTEMMRQALAAVGFDARLVG